MQIAKQNLPLMSKSTAIWLVDNTSLTFKQIADFCGMHELEIKGIADGDVAKGIVGINPVTLGQLTQDEINRCSADPLTKLQISKAVLRPNVKKTGKKARYTPISRRRDKPDAIFWLIKTYPEVSDTDITKLIGTTKNTIQSIRSKTYWNIAELRPRDPVLLGICTQKDIDLLEAKLLKLKEQAQAQNAVIEKVVVEK